MRPIVIEAGINEVQYDSPIKKIPDSTNEELQAFYDWLKQFQAKEYTGVLAIWKLKTPEWWHNMVTLFSQHNTREQKLLREARAKARRAWWKKHGKEEEAVPYQHDSVPA